MSMAQPTPPTRPNTYIAVASLNWCYTHGRPTIAFHNCASFHPVGETANSMYPRCDIRFSTVRAAPQATWNETQ